MHQLGALSGRLSTSVMAAKAYVVLQRRPCTSAKILRGTSCCTIRRKGRGTPSLYVIKQDENMLVRDHSKLSKED